MLKPLHGNIILEKEKAGKETTTASGIILVDNAKNAPNYATVVAIGSDSKADIKENDKVVYEEYFSTDAKLDEEEYTIIKAEDILAVLA